MHVEQPRGAGALVQIVDVLRHHEDLARPVALEPGKRQMRCVGRHAGVAQLRAAQIVEALHQLGIARDGRGNIAVDARQRTNVERVYACGDAHKGASLIVWAIALGRETARHVDAELRAGASVLPARGVDQPFERR